MLIALLVFSFFLIEEDYCKRNFENVDFNPRRGCYYIDNGESVWGKD